MILRHISTALSLAIATASFTLSAASVSDYPEISRYVGPSRTPSAPAAFHYMPDGTSYLTMSSDGGKLIRRDIRSDKELETLLDLSHTRETTINSFEDFTISPDGSKIMLKRKSRQIYRHSFSAEYYIYEIRTRLLRPLSANHPRQQSPVFSPDGRMVAFMADNNIYIKKIDYNSEVAVTTDGELNRIINGVPDWTYEEEFATTCSMVWSPDNLTLAYLKYNETDVPAFSFQLYEGYCEPMPQYALYPGEYTYKYPVAGQANSKVSLHVYDVETRATKQIALPDQKIEYIPRITFGGASDRLMVTTLNREQNRMELYSVNPRSTVVKSLLVEQSSAWLTPVTYEGISYHDNFFVINSSRSGWNHLYVYAYTGALQRQLTSGEYDIDRYYGYAPKLSPPTSPTVRHGPLLRLRPADSLPLLPEHSQRSRKPHSKPHRPQRPHHSHVACRRHRRHRVVISRYVDSGDELQQCHHTTGLHSHIVIRQRDPHSRGQRQIPGALRLGSQAGILHHDIRRLHAQRLHHQALGL